MKRIYTTALISICFYSFINGQSTQDTIDFPFWQAMMKDRSVCIHHTKRAYDLYFSNKEKIKGSGWKQFERWYNNAQYFVDSNGFFLPPDHVVNEIAKFKRNNLTARSTTGQWECLGPFNNPAPASMQRGVGRISEIAFHPYDPNTIYAGAAAGGFWKSVNKGQTWTSGTDNIPSFGVSAIAVIPNGNNEPIIIAGSGDRDAGDAPGLGTFISTDGGMNFTASNTGMGNKLVNKLIVNPLDSNVVIAATQQGIYRSFNQGASWILSSSSIDMKDIKYCPSDTSIVYACSSTSFFRSTDGGATWTVITSGFSSTFKVRLAIAVTKANPDIVYVIAVNNANGMEALYKSSNKGVNFTSILLGTTYNPLGTSTNGKAQGGQGWYDLAIESSQTDSNVVFIGGVNIFKSTDGGKTFRCVAYWSYSPTIPWVHADCHYLGRNPLNNELWIGTDGGIDYTTNEGTSYNNVNSGLAVSQFYNLGVSQLSKDNFITGAQDNGTSSGMSSTTWTAELAGDGMECEMSNFSLQYMVGSSQYGGIQRTINGGNSWSGATNGISESGQWVVPHQIHPRLDNIFITVFKNVWISKDIFGTTTPTYVKSTNGIVSNGSAIRCSNANDSIVYVGWEDGPIRVCTNILATTPSFTSISSTGSGKVNDIETSYIDKNTLWMSRGNRIYRSRNAGTAWTDITGNLPNVTIYTIAADKYASEGIYVGTASGIYYRDSTMSTWKMFSKGLSLNCQIRDLEIVHDNDCSKNSVIYAATYGRGLWRSSVYSDSIGFISIAMDKSSPQCAGDKITVTCAGGDSYAISPTKNATKVSDNVFELKPSVSTIYTITGKNAQNDCDVKTADITILPLPSVKVNPTSKTINIGDTVLITGSGASSYLWTPTSNLISGASSSTLKIKPISNTTYTLTGTGSNGCKGTAKSVITVLGGVGIQSSMGENSHYRIYPNPAHSMIHISSNHSFQVKIYDIAGKSVYSDIQFSADRKIDVSQFPIGQYIVESISEKGVTETMNITISR